MSLSPKISVIVPVYRVEECLNKCVDSILGQTYANLEVILVDDGSPDNSGAICDVYVKKDHRVKVIHQENMGLSMARNNGMSIATGAYVSFIDSDDTIDSVMFEKMMEMMTSNNLKVVECIFKINGEIVYGEPQNDIPSIQTLDQALLRLHYKSFFNVTNKLYAFDLIKDIQFIKGKINEDILYSSQVWQKIDKVGFIPEGYYNYSQEGESIQRSSYSIAKVEGLWVICNSLENFRKLARSKKSDELLRKNLLKNLLINFHQLLENEHLVNSKQNLQKIQEMIRKSSKLKFTSIYYSLANVLALPLYRFFFNLNRKRIKLQNHVFSDS
jgi:glycosyltransferase involved in cell wall biosynthesis